MLLTSADATSGVRLKKKKSKTLITSISSMAGEQFDVLILGMLVGYEK